MLASISLPAFRQYRRSMPPMAWLRALLVRRQTRAELQRLLETSPHLLVDVGLDPDEVAAALGRRPARR